ncbi:MAG: hypothetical protein EAZ91_00005, partial [Cytophagales bacterium]
SVNRFAFISLLFTVKSKVFTLFFTGSLLGVQDTAKSRGNKSSINDAITSGSEKVALKSRSWG